MGVRACLRAGKVLSGSFYGICTVPIFCITFFTKTFSKHPFCSTDYSHTPELWKLEGLICILTRSSGVEAFLSPPPKDPSLCLKPPWNRLNLFPPRRFFLTNTDCFEEDFHVCGVTFADWCLTMEG